MQRIRAAITLLALAMALPLAGCALGSSDPTPQLEGAPCLKACDAAMDACSRECGNNVDNELCAQECIDRLKKCKERC
jgi:hypothetical protein